MKKSKLLSLACVLVLAISTSASAVVVTNDWTLDLTGIDGIGSEVITDIGQITYNGIAHSTTVAANNPSTTPPPSTAAATSYVDGLLWMTAFVNTGGSGIFGTGLNSDYQMTFDFSVDVVNYNQQLNGDTSTIHLAANHPGTQYTNGLLDVWVDGPTDGVSVAANSTGLGFQNGVKIATFSVLYGDGGIFTPSTFDGSDDATFELTWALDENIFLDASSNPLVQLDGSGNVIGDTLLFAITDSNFDGNPEGITPDGFNIGGTGNTYPTIQDTWPFASNTFGGAGGLFAEEDGSARIGTEVVPEPSTLLLLGIGLLGLGAYGRKRMNG